MKTVFFDIDTQLDFVYPAGSLYVPKAERIVPTIARLNHYAAQHGMPIVSTMDAHLENDIEFKAWPHHCVAGALGQHKAEPTLLEKRVVIPNREVALNIAGAQQIIVEKQTVNVFDTANITHLLDALAADSYVVYGVVTEICVLHAARGLLQTGKSVTIVTDAIEALTPEASAKTLAEIQSRGGLLKTAAQVTA